MTSEAFERLVNDGTVKPETLVWAKDMAEWQPYSTISADTAVCTASGGRHWQRNMVPYEGKFISAEHKEQFFQRLREGVNQPNEMVYGNFGIRFVAKLIDGIVGGVRRATKISAANAWSNTPGSCFARPVWRGKKLRTQKLSVRGFRRLVSLSSLPPASCFCGWSFMDLASC